MTIPTFISLLVLAGLIALIYKAYRWISPSLRNIAPGKGGIETDHDLHALTIQNGTSGDSGGHSAVWLTPKQK